MKALRKNIQANGLLSSMKRKPKDASANENSVPDSDTPETSVATSVRNFCECGGPNGQPQDDGVLYLPTIVDAAESSPTVAKECALLIRKYLAKTNSNQPYLQYNAIMLIRILADNPGSSFTRNLDEKFVQTTKDLLRTGADPSVKQILMQTLDTFQREKSEDPYLAGLLEMWRREQEKMAKILGSNPVIPRQMNAPPFDPRAQTYFSRHHHRNKLPGPQELVARIEEARNSAQLLTQVVQSTPPAEVGGNELIREFADRCQSASRSVQAYMVSEDPAPDNQTMETLIETNEQLGKAMSLHQRTLLAARKAASADTPPPVMGAPGRTDSGFAAPPPGPPPSQTSKPSVPPRNQGTSSGHLGPSTDDGSNPFADQGRRSTSSLSQDVISPIDSNDSHPRGATTTRNEHRGNRGNHLMTAELSDDEPSPIEPESATLAKPRYHY